MPYRTTRKKSVLSRFITGKAAFTAVGALVLAGCSGVIPQSGDNGQATQQQGGSYNPGSGTGQSGAQQPGHRYATGQAVQLSGDPQSAAGQYIARGPDVAQLGLNSEDARDAMVVFRNGCPTLTNAQRSDASGLTSAQDWQAPCRAVQSWPDNDAVRFFTSNFETVQIGDGNAFATGYFEPEIAASRTRSSGYDTPIYGRPNDLIDVDLGQFGDEWKGKTIRGKVQGTKLVLYEDRAAIDQGALSGRAQVLAWAADPIELFFLQVQGSGRLRLPDGSVMRIGYASQNGRDYTGIGRLMRDRGLLEPGKANMEGIIEWLRAHPAEGRQIMMENKSYVFFSETTGPGPLGAMGYPVYAYSSAAVDPKFIPMGAPVFLDMDRAEPNGLWVAQDTGGAIKGANRFDTFWGAGAQARHIAGGMSARGQALLLLPRGSFDRLARSRGQ